MGETSLAESIDPKLVNFQKDVPTQKKPNLYLVNPPQHLESSAKKKNGEVPHPPEKSKFIFDRSKIEDESKNFDKAILDPLTGVDPAFEAGTKNNLDYLCRTGDLEFNTPRTQILQNIVDKMTGQDGIHEKLMTVSSKKAVEARIVIKNKGEADDAFVLPDGTIVLSQSLIDKLTLDEVGGVMAHEINHIRTETAAKKEAAGGHAFGVCWAHETAEDALAPDLLVKADLNSLGFSSAIIKVSGAERGSIHQSGLSRGSQSVGQHFGLDFGTSSQEQTPLPELLKTKEPIKKTNLEVMGQLIRQQEPENVEQTLSLLHPHDLKDAYQHIINQERGGEYWSPKALTEEQKKIIELGSAYLNNRLEEAGYSQTERNLFFIFMQSYSARTPSFSMIKTPEMVLEATRALPDYINFGGHGDIHRSLFDKEITGSTVESFLNIISARMHDTGISPQGQNEIPITKEILLKTLTEINSWENIANGLKVKGKAGVFTQVIESYISKTYISTDNAYKKLLDETKTRELLQEVKDLNIPINLDTLHTRMSASPEERKVYELFKEFFVEKSPKTTEQSIDDFLDSYIGLPENEKGGELDYFMKIIRKDFDEKELTDAQRINYVKYFGSKVKELDLSSNIDLNKELNLNIKEIPDKELFQRNLLEFNMQSNAALALLQKDGEEFYDYIKVLMDKSGIDIQNCSPAGIYNLSASLINIDKGHFYNFDEKSVKEKDYVFLLNQIKIENINKYLQLPFLQKLMEESEKKLSFTTLKDLNKYIDTEIFQKRLDSRSSSHLFEDTLSSIITLKPVRENFLELLQRGVPEDEYPQLYKFIKLEYPSGPREKEFLRALNVRYLDKPIGSQNELHERIDYLKQNFNSVGPEGMALLANHINTLPQYLHFRKEMAELLATYLDGSGIVSAVAMGDFATSFFTKHFADLLESSKTDKQTKSKLSTDMAKEWFKFFFIEGSNRDKRVNFDKETGKIELNGTTRDIFKTFADLVKEIKGLSELKRFAITHKSLVDTGGALTDDNNRKQLGEILNASLETKSTFISHALQKGCELAPAEFFSFPISKMLAPLLFRSLDTNYVDLKKVSREDYEDKVPYKQLPVLFGSDTRDVTLFGAHYKGETNTKVAQMAIESDDQYHLATQLLDRILTEEPVIGAPHKEPDEKVKVDPNTEAIISAVEASGPLGKRCLQLSRQLHEFAPATDRRLANSFDSTPGLNKLFLWENLVRHMENGHDPELSDFIKNNLVELNDVIAGGSLNTVASAKVKDEKGNTRSAVLRYLNPNPEVFIAKTHETAQKVLEAIELTGNSQDRKFARMGLVFTDLSREWCLRDINDPTYEKDDDEFRETIRSFNEQKATSFYAPERLFTHRKLKVEEEAEGRTINKLLNDANISVNEKKETVNRLMSFFDFQLTNLAGTSETGENYYLIHSDPHVGNYMMENGNLTENAVLDRNMYLKINGQEANMFHNLLNTGDYKTFIDPFIDALLDKNKVINETTRNESKKRIMRSMKTEYLKQQMYRMVKFRSTVDNFSLIRSLMNECAEAKLDIPLEMRLMIRNVEIFRNLAQKYS